ncbi:MAG: 4Fe-4S single cluster domain-containing protein [Candidatus Calescibacterium sp.]|nr:radical SAM protein [Candidatus Calescibacterium sp.]MCX7972235.1 radical SAM protein [bacterium]MDW8195164.1 4Fe-4S single cluster domain-containing protein [Candidatus Calescibacterium sp.]
MKIFVNSFYYPIYTLGPGVRIGLWLQGCSIKCKNCISRHTWYISPEYQMDTQILAEKINSIPCLKITISGGEPLDQAPSLIHLLKLIRKTKNDILLYTGYELEKYIQKHTSTWEELRYLVDVIIDGPFIWGQETEYVWKGSENQKMYILNPKLLPLYEEYKNKTKNKKLQIIEYRNNFLLVGIPYQKDYEKLVELTKLF